MVVEFCQRISRFKLKANFARVMDKVFPRITHMRLVIGDNLINLSEGKTKCKTRILGPVAGIG